jgi:hypothetical protein
LAWTGWRKDGDSLCWLEIQACSHHSGSIDLSFTPYAPQVPLPQIKFPRDVSDLQCGESNNPQPCFSGLKFGVQIQWQTILRLKGFHPGMLGGYSKDVQFRDLNQNLPYDNIHRYEVIGTNYTTDASIISQIRNTDPGMRQFADLTNDNYGAWLWDSNNDSLLRFPEKCRPNSLPGPIAYFMFNTYNAGNPSWDELSKSLSITVSSPHFSSNGQLASGYYEMYFPTQLAKCMWNLNSTSNLKAEISILSSDGAPDIAAVTQSLDSTGLKVIASNFHFSSPTIKVKLSDGVTTPNVSSKSEKPISAVTKTIVCVKGHNKRVINGISPKCPAGFKTK